MNPRDLTSSLPVRLVVLFVALVAVDLVFQLALVLVLPQVQAPLRAAIRIVDLLLLAAAMIAAYRLLVRCTERRRAAELAAHNAVSSLLLSTLAGGALFAVVFGVLVAVGAASVHGVGGFKGIGAALTTAAAAAVVEELIFRGVLFRLLEEGLGTTFALALSIGAFALLHALNPGASLVSTLAIATASGLLLALTYSVSRTLWVPIGAHFGWSFTAGWIFGTGSSGEQLAGLLSTSLSGPRVLTGGQFGPDASLVAFLVSLAAAAGVAWVVRQRGRWKALPPAPKRQAQT